MGLPRNTRNGGRSPQGRGPAPLPGANRGIDQMCALVDPHSNLSHNHKKHHLKGGVFPVAEMERFELSRSF